MLLAKQLSGYRCVDIERSTIMYGESLVFPFDGKGRNHALNLSFRRSLCRAAFLWKAMISCHLVQKCPLQGHSSYWQHWLEHFLFLSVESRFLVGSFMGGQDVIKHILFIARPPNYNTRRELCCLTVFLYAVLIRIGCESIWLHIWALPSCSLIAPVLLVVA